MRLIAQVGFCLVLASCASVQPNSPEACAVRQLGSFAVENDRNWGVTTVSFDGVAARLVVDTGSPSTLLTEDAAKRMNIQTDRTRTVLLSGVGRTLQVHQAVADQLEVGGLTVAHIEFVISPISFPSPKGPPVDGVLGGDFLARFDVDIDLPRGRVALYRSRNCPNEGPPGPDEFTSIPVAPYWGTLYRKPYITASLDGKARTTLVDTGSQIGMVSADAAAAAGVTEEALAQDRSITSYGATPDPQATRLHRFRELVVGPERFSNPAFIVVPKLGTEAGLVLGADFLRHHRLWISYASNRVYLGPAVATSK